MGSTWFNKVTGYKSENSENVLFGEYILIASATSSNVTGIDGKHEYSDFLFCVGDYYDCFKEICATSAEFEGGTAKWKPSNKTPEGFIRTCRNALKNAMTITTFPEYYMLWVADDNKDPLGEILLKFEGFPGVKTMKFYDCQRIDSNNVNFIVNFMRFKTQILNYCKSEKKDLNIEIVKELVAKQYFYKVDEKILAIFKEN